MSYAVRITAAATKYLEKLRDQALLKRLTQAIRNLGTNPRPHGCVKLATDDHLYRVRVGDYRIVYQVRDAEVLVLVVAIGHRREIYR